MSITPITHDIPSVAKQFSMPGDLLGHQPCGHGLINDTYEVRYSQGGVAVRYVIQRINHHVFQRPELVMDNIVRVTTHISKKLEISGGTDHGTASNMFVIGETLKKKGVFNEAPDLVNLADGDLKHHIDFRQVYATVLDNWLKADSVNILGERFVNLGFV